MRCRINRMTEKMQSFLMNTLGTKKLCMGLFASGSVIFLAPTIRFAYWAYTTFKILRPYRDNIGYMESCFWVGAISGIVLYVALIVFWACVCSIIFKKLKD